MRTIHLSLVLLAVGPTSAAAQRPADLDRASGQDLYLATCANCHGADGTGLDRALVGFEEALPDFTDCRFASREPAADWVAIAHQGGPIRGFSQMMPAFGGALTEEQLGRVVDYVKSLCTDHAWPRGELNLPRAMFTEKAFPEDEWVIEADAALEGDAEFSTAFVYEKRFGPRAQLEAKIPYTVKRLSDAAHDGFVGGLGDVALGMKYAFHHDYASGTIASLSGEVALPTGDEAKGIGADGAKLEGFLSFGKIVAADGFLQAQAGVETGLYDGGEAEGFARLVLGRTWTSGPWGRSWTPMVEVLAVRELEGGSVVLDLVPQMQISLNTRQHVLFNVGVLVPTTQREGRSLRLVTYLLLDWFDGGFFEGW